MMMMNRMKQTMMRVNGSPASTNVAQVVEEAVECGNDDDDEELLDHIERGKGKLPNRICGNHYHHHRGDDSGLLDAAVVVEKQEDDNDDDELEDDAHNNNNDNNNNDWQSVSMSELSQTPSSRDIDQRSQALSSDENTETTMHNNNNNTNQQQQRTGAEGIVQAEAKMIRNLRLAVMLIIASAAAACGYLIFKISSQNETNAFRQSFQEAATKFTKALSDALGEDLNYAYALSVFISNSGLVQDQDDALTNNKQQQQQKQQQSSPFPNVSIPHLDILTKGLTNRGLVDHFTWSPLLRTEEERKQWEEYALSNINWTSQPTFPPCFACGMGNDILNHDDFIAIQGQLVKCYNMYHVLLVGTTSPQFCPYMSEIVKTSCGCQNAAFSSESLSSSSVNNTTNSSTMPSPPSQQQPSPSDNEIFYLDFTRTTHSTSATTTTTVNGVASNSGRNSHMDFVTLRDQGPPPYSPVWQLTPSVNSIKVALFNLMSTPWRHDALQNMIQYGIPAFSETYDPNLDGVYVLNGIPTSGVAASLFFPVFQAITSDAVVGSLVLDFSWIRLFNYILPPRARGVVIVLESSLGQKYTFQVGHQIDDIHDNVMVFLGEGDFHDPHYDHVSVESTFEDFVQLLRLTGRNHNYNSFNSHKSSYDATSCAYRVRLYPSREFEQKHKTHKPIFYTVLVVSAFGLTSLVFLAYDWILRRLQAKVLDSAKRSEAIVSSIFPALVRDRIFGSGNNNNNRNASNDEDDEDGDEEGGISSNDSDQTPRSNSKLFGGTWFLTTKRKKKRSKKRELHLANHLVNHKTRLRSYLSNPPSFDLLLNDSDPIADLYPNTTVMFADIAGFTAWSSEREPSQVFKLLESLFGEFDEVARELGVFKVETMSDCYVAVTGLPEKMKHHAVVMVEFACRCLVRMHQLVSRLELVLGPGTADLSVRIGLHSGPVTAGVLRGDRARFQLFGDTLNVASGLEGASEPNLIHISQETANLLIKAGKGHWITPRQETVAIKGKGQLQTYWAKPSPSLSSGSNTGDANNGNGAGNTAINGDNSASGRRAPAGRDSMMDVHQTDLWGGTSLENSVVLLKSGSSSQGRERLVDWFADLLYGLLQKIASKSNSMGKPRIGYSKEGADEAGDDGINIDQHQFVDEITETIEMPNFNERVKSDTNSIELGPAARAQLRDYVALIASLYRDNPFHNFEHACHVAMSSSKLLKRIIAPEDVEYRQSGNKIKSHKKLSKEIHESTFGISSDPLMQFAVVFSALIHDVDHTGLTNNQLVKENDPLAVKYRGKCVAEQRSIQLSWAALMEPRFEDLRRCIYQTEHEKQRFRQLLVNAVIATDIADKDLSTWRKNRWDKVFHQEPSVADSGNMSDRKATIVFEYIIQASDVAHTMQHWQVYQKWNKRLFDERYAAYLAGREPMDPSVGWHKGEIWFFDNYIIPLAKKLEECNVFGVSCDEFLTYALQNRHEWEVKGEAIVGEMVASQVPPASNETDVGKEESIVTDESIGTDEQEPVVTDDELIVTDEQATHLRDFIGLDLLSKTDASSLSWKSLAHAEPKIENASVA